MPSPTKAHQRYRNLAQVIVPGVTTVIGVLDKPALVPWAWRLGMAGEDMNKTKDLAADIGTCTHYLIECHLTGEDPDLDHFTPFCLREAQILFKEFLKWLKRQQYETLGCEVQLVSENWQFGGTIDWVAKYYGETTLFDFKTSTGIYQEAEIQMAAYWEMWDENHTGDPIQQVVIIHLDKKTHTMTPHPYVDLELEWEMFKHCRSIYVLKRNIKNRNADQKKAAKPAPKRGPRLQRRRVIN